MGAVNCCPLDDEETTYWKRRMKEVDSQILEDMVVRVPPPRLVQPEASTTANLLHASLGSPRDSEMSLQDATPKRLLPDDLTNSAVSSRTLTTSRTQVASHPQLAYSHSPQVRRPHQTSPQSTRLESISTRTAQSASPQQLAHVPKPSPRQMALLDENVLAGYVASSPAERAIFEGQMNAAEKAAFFRALFAREQRLRNGPRAGW